MNVTLSESAKDAVIKAAIRRANFEGLSPEDRTQTEREVAEVVSSLALIKKGWVSFADVEQSLADATAGKVIAVLPKDIERKASELGMTLTPVVEERIITDLKRQSVGLAKSGAPESYIRRTNEKFVFALYSKTPARPINAQVYKQVRMAFFDPLVHVTITSEPTGAEVDISGRRVGKTVIEKKPLEAGREYILTFRLPKYRPARRVIYVIPGEREQSFQEVLLPEEETGRGR